MRLDEDGNEENDMFGTPIAWSNRLNNDIPLSAFRNRGIQSQSYGNFLSPVNPKKIPGSAREDGSISIKRGDHYSRTICES